ncbi:hypothetical protein ACLIYM_19765 [Streptomyces fenghuangensis]|uniref:hypothetical protein n=1 Tax=Streptomyces sp. ICN903 TaxID=2964654 RepID=UPI001EDA2A69|nr:hypothetical protein [Streptomyces sp. ICN903]MCG3039644.1 hypothetical protein [Streptomyces sp. ICN903]
MPERAASVRPTFATYALMAMLTGIAAALLGAVYLIYREMVVTGGCGSRYSGVACSMEQTTQIVAAIFLLPISMLYTFFLNWVVFRPYRRGHEAYRLIVPLLLAADATVLLTAAHPVGGSVALAAAAGLLLVSGKPVGVRGMVWGLSKERFTALVADPEGRPFSTGQNLLLLCANTVGTAAGLTAAHRFVAALT